MLVYKTYCRSLVRLLTIGIFFFANSPTHAQDFFINAGINIHTLDLFTGIEETDNNSNTYAGYHVGLGVRNNYGFSKRHRFGFGVDFDEINGDPILALRALDYQYDLREKIRVGAFFGAAKLKSGASQNGYYLGTGLTFYDVLGNADAGFELRHGNGLARDRLPSEPQEGPNGERVKPDVFLDFLSLAFFLGWSF